MVAIGPVSGEYRLKYGAAGFRAPSSRSVLGLGPVQSLGWFDTRPELEPYDAAAHASIAPRSSPGGVRLRWCSPRFTDYRSGYYSYPMPAWGDSGAVVLFLAGFDVLPSGDWRRGYWPGNPPVAYNTGWELGASIGTMSPLVTTGPGISGAASSEESRDGFRYAARSTTRPMLDLLAYAGGPWAEADLVELAGGCRYIGAWLRAFWSRKDGVDGWADINFRIPWVLEPGRARNALHRSAWHTAFPYRASPVASLSAAKESGSLYGVGSPIAGDWVANFSHNGGAGDPSLWAWLKTRSGIWNEASSVTVPATGAALEDGVIALSRKHGGHAVVACGFDSADPTKVFEGVAHVTVIGGGSTVGAMGVGP